MRKSFISSLFQMERDYAEGRISEQTFAREAERFTECGRAWADGGDFVCYACVANFSGWTLADVADVREEVFTA